MVIDASPDQSGDGSLHGRSTARALMHDGLRVCTSVAEGMQALALLLASALG